MKMRIVEKLTDGNWEKLLSMSELSEGDTFRLWEEDGKAAENQIGSTVFEAVGEPYLNENGRWTINTNPL